MFRYTDDPLADYAAYEAELARLEKLVPKCCKCRRPIMEDFCYELNEDKQICAECLDDHHKKKNANVFDLVCDYCGEYIDDEHYYENDDHEVFHKACVDKRFKKRVEVY